MIRVYASIKSEGLEYTFHKDCVDYKEAKAVAETYMSHGYTRVVGEYLENEDD